MHSSKQRTVIWHMTMKQCTGLGLLIIPCFVSGEHRQGRLCVCWGGCLFVLFSFCLFVCLFGVGCFGVFVVVVVVVVLGGWGYGVKMWHTMRLSVNATSYEATPPSGNGIVGFSINIFLSSIASPFWFAWNCHQQERKQLALRPQKPLRLIRDGEVGGWGILFLTPIRCTVTTRMTLH